MHFSVLFHLLLCWRCGRRFYKNQIKFVRTKWKIFKTVLNASGMSFQVIFLEEATSHVQRGIVLKMTFTLCHLHEFCFDELNYSIYFEQLVYPVCVVTIET